jgi:SLT domain-containing protein
MATTRPQKAIEAYMPVEAMPIPATDNRALVELQWHEESAYWEGLRIERQQLIEIAEYEREQAAIGARELAAKRRQWSRRMHAAKAAKHKAKH